MNWPLVALGEVVEFLDNLRRPVTASDRVEGPYPYYGANGQQGTIDGYIFDEPLLLLAEDGGHFSEPSRGIAYPIAGKTWVNNHAHVLRMTAKLDLRYAYHALARRDVRKYVTGTTRAKLTKTGAAAITVPLPPLAEQRRIAAFLDGVDSLGVRRERVKNEIRQVEQALFSDAFAGIDVEELGDKLCFVTSGGRGWAKYYSDQGSPFIRSLDVQMGTVSSDDLAYVAAPDNAEARRTRTRSGDVLLTITGSRIGRASVLPQDLAGAHISQHVAILRPDLKQMRPEYLAAFLCASGAGQVQIRAAQYGQTKPGLNFDQIRRFRIPNADLASQDRFCEKVAAARRLAAVADEVSGKLEELSASLRSRAFSEKL